MSNEKPNSFAPVRKVYATSAFFNKDFDGIHPTFRHTPPIHSLSIMAVFNPSCDDRMAATYPPGPAPNTTTSYSLILLLYISDKFLHIQHKIISITSPISLRNPAHFYCQFSRTETIFARKLSAVDPSNMRWSNVNER